MTLKQKSLKSVCRIDQMPAKEGQKLVEILNVDDK